MALDDQSRAAPHSKRFCGVCFNFGHCWPAMLLRIAFRFFALSIFVWPWSPTEQQSPSGPPQGLELFRKERGARRRAVPRISMV